MPKNNMYFCLKSLKIDNIPSIRYKMIWWYDSTMFKLSKTYDMILVTAADTQYFLRITTK